MYLDATDARPRSLFDRSSPSPSQIVAGVLVATLVHVALPLAVAGTLAALTAVGVLVETPPAPPAPIENVIQARFLQLGEILDPRRLPNRRVPILRTDVPEPAPSPQADPSRTPPPRQPRERQRDAVADALQRLSNDAQIFAEREERRLQEGDPEGIEGGEREASEGDLYAGRLSMFFRRGWTVPTTLDRDELADLSTSVQVEIGDDLRIRAFRITRSSGNADFDLSVSAQLQRLVDSQATIPPPPEQVADQYLGRTRDFRFRGRDAR